MPVGAPEPTSKPVAPYLAVGLSTIVYGVAERKHIKVNLDTIEDNIHAAMSMVNINMPVKLIALAEGALTGFTDEAFDLPPTLAARELFIDVPGPRQTGWRAWPASMTPTSWCSARRAGPRSCPTVTSTPWSSFRPAAR